MSSHSMSSQASSKSTELTQPKAMPENRVPLSKRYSCRRYIVHWPVVFSLRSERVILPPKDAGGAVPEGALDTERPFVSEVLRIAVEHEFGNTLLNLEDPLFSYLNLGHDIDAHTLVNRSKNLDIRCDAVSNGRNNWTVLKMWVWKTGEHHSSESMLMDKLWPSTGSFVESATWCSGTITSIPSHDLAIASVGELTVAVPIESLIPDVIIGRSLSPVDEFVKEGSLVDLKIAQVGRIIRAEECWGTGACSREAIKHESYNSKWDSSDKFGEGILICKFCDYYVLVSGFFLPFRRDKIFLNGELATNDQLEDSLNHPVACIYNREEVVYAWIGRFKPWDLLRDKLVVPDSGMVTIKKNYYMAIVEECPFPGYVICRLGVLPVLLIAKPKVGTAPNYATGDVIRLCFEEEKEVDGGYVLLARPMDMQQNLSLLLHFTGRIESLPSPGYPGSIALDKLNVDFEWNCVKPFTDRVTDISSYFERVKRVLKTEEKVEFTACLPSLNQTPLCVELFVA